MDIQTVSIVVAAIGVFIAAINSIFSSRRAEEQRQLTLETQQQALETRQAQLFSQIHAWWRSRDAIKAYGNIRYRYQWTDLEDWRTKYGPSFGDPEGYADFMTIYAFFEGIGVLVKKRLIDVELVEDLFSRRIIWLWEMMQPSIDKVRRSVDDPTQYDSIEYLYNLMIQREQQAKVVRP